MGEKPQYTVQGMEVAKGQTPLQPCSFADVMEGDVNWRPTFSPGYYNTEHTGCIWLGWSATVQYKVGLNPRSVPGRTLHLPMLGQSYGPRNADIGKAKCHGHQPVPIHKAITLLQGDHNFQAVAVSKQIGLHRLPGSDLVLVVWNARQVLGLVEDAMLVVERMPDIATLLPQGVPVRYETAEVLGTLFTQARQNRPIREEDGDFFEEDFDDDDDGDGD